jgi:hypothetical protein
MKFYVKPKKPESEDELMHFGRLGQKSGVHKFGRWQRQAKYANGQPDPNAKTRLPDGPYYTFVKEKDGTRSRVLTSIGKLAEKAIKTRASGIVKDLNSDGKLEKSFRTWDYLHSVSENYTPCKWYGKNDDDAIKKMRDKAQESEEEIYNEVEEKVKESLDCRDDEETKELLTYSINDVFDENIWTKVLNDKAYRAARDRYEDYHTRARRDQDSITKEEYEALFSESSLKKYLKLDLGDEQSQESQKRREEAVKSRGKTRANGNWPLDRQRAIRDARTKLYETKPSALRELDRAINKDEFQLDFLEAIQNSKIEYDGDAQAIAIEYAYYLLDPEDYMKNRELPYA